MAVGEEETTVPTTPQRTEWVMSPSSAPSSGLSSRSSSEGCGAVLSALAHKAGLSHHETNSLLVMVDSYATTPRSPGGADCAQCQVVQRQLKALRRKNDALTEHLTELEREMSDRSFEGHRVDAHEAHIAALKKQNEELKHEVEELVLRVEAERAGASSHRHAEQEDVLELTKELNQIKQQLLDLQLERNAAVQENTRLGSQCERLAEDLRLAVDELRTHLEECRVESSDLIHLESENETMKSRIHHLEEALDAKDQTIADLKESLDDQMLLTQQHSTAGGAFRGSLMNEIEDLMRMGDLDAAGPSSSSSHGRSPEKERHQSSSNNIDQHDSGNEQQQNGLTQDLLLKLLPMEADPNKMANACATVEGGKQVESELMDTVRLYAATSQHLAGHKIVTPEQANSMSVAELSKLSMTMKQLVEGRSRRLVEELAARDRLRTEVDLKKTTLIPLINMFFMTQQAQEANGASACSSPAMLVPPGVQALKESAHDPRSRGSRGSRSVTPSPMASTRSNSKTSPGSTRRLLAFNRRSATVGTPAQ